jgi:hypothetical protein
MGSCHTLLGRESAVLPVSGETSSFKDVYVRKYCGFPLAKKSYDTDLFL